MRLLLKLCLYCTFRQLRDVCPHFVCTSMSQATTLLMLTNVLSVTFFLLCVTHCVCTLPAGQPVCSGEFQAVAEMGSLQPETGFFRQLGILLDWVSGSSTSLLRHSDSVGSESWQVVCLKETPIFTVITFQWAHFWHEPGAFQSVDVLVLVLCLPHPSFFCAWASGHNLEKCFCGKV